jgi:hypothetical protein
MTTLHGPEGLAPLFAGALALAACASGAARPSPTTATATAPTPAAPPSPAPAAAPGDPLLGLGRPFHGQRLNDQALPPGAELLDQLSTADLVCFGERHAEPIDHWAELAVMFGLSERAELSGRRLGLGLEMWDVEAQPAIDRYAAGKLDEPALLEVTRWQQRWGHDFALYRPTVHLAQAGGGIIGLDAPHDLVRRVARQGLDGLEPEAQAALPELDLDDTDHHAAFVASSRARPSRHDPEHRYAAAVLRDENHGRDGERVARRPASPRASSWSSPAVEHCRHPAVPARVTRRLAGARALSVRLPPAAPAGDPHDLDGYDFAFLLGEAE